MAGRVIGHPMRIARADIGHAEDVDEQLGELVRTTGHVVGTGGEAVVTLLARDVGVLMTHRSDARARWGDDGVGTRAKGRLEDVYMMDHERQRFALIAAVDVHLTATRLTRREDHLVAEALEQHDRRLRRPREEGVRETRGEQCDAHGQVRCSDV